MGQAKQRGSKEQRIKEALARGEETKEQRQQRREAEREALRKWQSEQDCEQGW